MQLELKHLSAYLPYKLNCVVEGYDNPLPMISAYYDDQNEYECSAALQEVTGNDFGFNPDEFKPILRPMTDLTKEIQLNSENFIPIEKISPVPNFFNVDFIKRTPLASSFEVVVKLLELHFDIFGLINEGLAVDINSL